MRVLALYIFVTLFWRAHEILPKELGNYTEMEMSSFLWYFQDWQHRKSWKWSRTASDHNFVKMQRFHFSVEASVLTHWGRVTHICVGNLTIIGSDNGLWPGRHQAITWTNVGISLIWPLGSNFSEMLIKIHTFSFKKIHLKMLSGKWRPFCLGLNVLI